MELSLFSIIVLIISGIFLSLALIGGIMNILAERRRRRRNRLLEMNSLAHRAIYPNKSEKYSVRYFTTPTYSIAREWEESKC